MSPLRTASSATKHFAKAMFRNLGLRVTRSVATNRFQAMEETLRQLRARGYHPRLIIDAGANIGQWTRLALAVFPNASFHMIEPQKACHGRLQQMMSANQRLQLHPVAVSEPGFETVAMAGVDGRGNTGASVTAPGPATYQIPATTLDTLTTGISIADRTLLKLDLEGHELSALRGANKLLILAEVVVLEAHLYDPDQLGRATFGDLFFYLTDHGFVIYDFASLSSRQRDGRLRQADIVFIRADSELLSDICWS